MPVTESSRSNEINVLLETSSVICCDGKDCVAARHHVKIEGLCCIKIYCCCTLNVFLLSMKCVSISAMVGI